MRDPFVARTWRCRVNDLNRLELRFTFRTILSWHFQLFSILQSFNFLFFMRVFYYDLLQYYYFQELMKYFYERNV